MQAYPFALQLYSIRDYADANPADALYRVKKMGYDHVETAGFYGLDATAYKALLDAAQLTAVSMHVGFEQIVGNLDEVIHAAGMLGSAYVAVPWLGAETCPDLEHWLWAVKTMDAAGECLRRAGIQLCYHNHAHEFAPLDGQAIFDAIFENSNAEHLQIQLDTCWAEVGGMDVVALLERYAGRVPLAHIKDCRPVVPEHPVVFTELGRGIMAFDLILPACKSAGVKWFIVEQDESQGDSMESAAANAEFMLRMNEAN